MSINKSFSDNVLDQFSGLEGISVLKIFGGIGVRRFGVMFAVIVDERLYFKVDVENKPDYQEAGSVPFIYDRHDKQSAKELVVMNYWEVPPQIWEDKDLIFQWMTKAHEAAVKAKYKEAI